MAPSRLVIALIVVTGISVSAGSQGQPPLPGPPGYRLVDSSVSENETEEFATSPIERERVTGRRVVGLYAPLPLLKKRPLDILRHYVTLAEARGGTRLWGNVDELGGQLTAFVPGPKPIWIDVRPADEGGGLEVIFVEETTPTPRQLPVPAERIAGDWGSSRQDLSTYPASTRAAWQALVDRIGAHWRASAPLTPPMGGIYLVATSAGEFQGESGQPPLDIRLIVRPRFQPCATCPVGNANEGRRLVEISINQIEKAAVLSAYKGPGETDWFEWRLAKQETPTAARTTDHRLVLTMPGRPSPWLPVTQEAYLAAQIGSLDAASRPPDLKKALAEQEEAIRAIEKVDPAAARAARAAMKEALASMGDVKGGLAPERERLEAELKALSPEDRRKPAILPNGAALVAKNPAFFRTDLPATVVQLAVVTYETPQDYFFMVLMDRLVTVDWAWLVDGSKTPARAQAQGARDR